MAARTPSRPGAAGRLSSARGRVGGAARTPRSSRSTTTRPSPSPTSASRSWPTRNAPPTPPTAARCTASPATGGCPARAGSRRVLAQTTGLVEVAEGRVDGGTLTAAVAGVGTASAKRVDVIERVLTVDGDELRYVVRMAAVGIPLTHHLRRRAAPGLRTAGCANPAGSLRPNAHRLPAEARRRPARGRRTGARRRRRHRIGRRQLRAHVGHVGGGHARHQRRRRRHRGDRLELRVLHRQARHLPRCEGPLARGPGRGPVGHRPRRRPRMATRPTRRRTRPRACASATPTRPSPAATATRSTTASAPSCPGGSLAWNAVGDGWTVPIAKTDINVVAPWTFTDTRCVTGTSGSTTAVPDRPARARPPRGAHRSSSPPAKASPSTPTRAPPSPLRPPSPCRRSTARPPTTP